MSQGEELDCNFTNYEDGALRQEYSNLVQSNLDSLPEQLQKAAADSSAKAIWEQIGEDFGSPSEERREQAFANAYSLLPELGGQLMDMLDERETHYEGWRHERGQDQRFVNEGMDYLSQLYIALVKEGRFQSAKNKDPRPYIRRALANWEKNQYRKDQRVIQPSEEELEKLLELPSSDQVTPSAEEEAMHNISDDALYSELVVPGYLTDREYQFYYAIYVEHWTIEELAKHRGMKPGTIRESLSQVHQKMILRRDRCIASKIHQWDAHWDERCRHFTREINFTDHAEWFPEKVEEAIKPALRTLTSIESSEHHAAFYVSECQRAEPVSFLHSSLIDIPSIHLLTEQIYYKKAVILPLTSGIGSRPGRLYLCDGRITRNEFNDYLLAQGFDPTLYYLHTWKNPTRNNGTLLCTRPTGFPILDKVIERISDIGREGVPIPPDIEVRAVMESNPYLMLGMLSYIGKGKKQQNERLENGILGDFPIGYDYPAGYTYSKVNRGFFCICEVKW